MVVIEDENSQIMLILMVIALFLPLTQGHHYVVTTYTGDRFGAGTDARVFIKLYGAKGATKERELESSGRDNFERGQLDTFLLDSEKDIGKIKRASIRHDNSWLGPGWYLEKLTVTSEEGDYYEFPVHKWLDKHQEDGKTTRELIPRPKLNHKKDEIAGDTTQPLDCSWPQGVSNGDVPDSQISASTSFNDLHLPYHARLGKIQTNSLGGWCPYKDDATDYLEVDLGIIKKIAGVATQGMGLVDEWSTAYRVMYSNKSGGNFKEYSENGNIVKNFIGNDDQNGTVLHWLKSPFISRYVRVAPLKWHGKGCLRLELYGCPVKTDNLAQENTEFIQVPERNEETFQSPLDHPTVQEQLALTADNVGLLAHHEVEGNKHQHIPSANQDDDDEAPKAIEIQLAQNEDETIDSIPIVHLDFDEIRDNIIPDVSGHHNDARLRSPIDIVMFSKSCERGLRINGGDIYFDGEFFIDKPRTEITVAVWVKLFSNGGQHSIFDTVGGKDSTHKDGQFHFEVDRGRLRWFHRNEAKEDVFNISSPLMVPAHVWTHCAATYSSISGKAAVFVNGKLGAQGTGSGTLSQDWSGRAGIGRHKGQRVLNGELDEFYIFAKALTPSKIEVLMRRCSFETDCQKALGMQSKLVKDTQISASSTYNLHKPFYGRVNLASFFGDPARTAWCANKEDKNPYIEVELPDLTSLTGVATQGLSIFDNWVTSFLFCYSDNRAIWNCYKEKGYDKIFEGNSDKNTIKRHYFHHPVDGKYIRIRPQSWYGNHLCMRAELYGCVMDLLPDPYDSFGSLPVFMEDTEAQTRTEISPKESCNNPMGVSNGEVDDMHLAASSALDSTHLPYYGRLVRESIDQSDVKGCWCARDVNLRQYIQADLGETKSITGIATQGYVAHDNWVASYRLGYSDDPNSLEWYRESDDERLFLGNTDRTGIVKHFLKRPVQARYVRINPRAWHGIHICMRFEVFGCREGRTKAFSQQSYHQPSDMDDIYLRTGVNHEKSVETGAYKHNIPKKKPAAKTVTHESQRLPHTQKTTAEKLKSQVKAHSHGVPEKLDVERRILPGKSTAREILHISYPKPKFNLHFFKNMSFSEPLAMLPVHRQAVKAVNAPTPKPKPAKPKSQTTLKPSLNKEKNILSMVNRLQDFSDDKIANELKGPILELAKQKLLEDLRKKQQVTPSAYSTEYLNCRRNGGDCNQPTPNVYKIPTINFNMAAMYPKPANLYDISQHPLPVKTPTINAAEILNNFPELRTNGINEEVLESLAERVPDLEKKIYAHFAMKNNLMLMHHHDVNLPSNYQQDDLAQSNLAFMKNYKDYMTYANRDAGRESEISAGLLPDQHRVDEVEVNRFVPTVKMSTWNAPTRPYYGKTSGYTQEYLPYANNYNNLDAPAEFENPCTRSDGCNPNFPKAGLVESYAYKPPHEDKGLMIKDTTDLVVGYHDNTKYTPENLLASGPDPRYVEYYNRYMQGKSMDDDIQQTPAPHTQPLTRPPLTNPPPLPPVAAPAQMPYIESSVTVEQLPPPVSIQTAFPVNQMESIPAEVPVVQHEMNNAEWTPFSVCSTTCGRGEKKRFRRCAVPDCPSGGVEIEAVPCAVDECPEVNPYSWSAYTPCSTTCGTGTSVRYRLCNTENCPEDGYETEQISCYKPSCPVCLLDFEVIVNSIVIDQSGHGNSGYLDKNAYIREHPQICGHYADLTNNGQVLISAQTFLNKPRNGITIACWINIQTEMNGKHSIFSTMREISPKNFIGGYHFELDNGGVRWFHRDEIGTNIFSIMTEQVTLPRVWMHITVTYDAYKGLAKVFVDGKERSSKEGTGLLAADWGYKASIGNYDFDDRRLLGWVDEFIIYDYALDEEQTFNLLGKMRCPTENTTTVEIDAFKFENIHNKRSLIDTSYKRKLNANETIELTTNNVTGHSKNDTSFRSRKKSKRSLIRKVKVPNR